MLHLRVQRAVTRIVGGVALAACAPTPPATLSPQAAQIRVTADPRIVHSCRNLGTVTGDGSNDSEAHDRMLNAAAKLGASTVLLQTGSQNALQKVFGTGAARATAIAYDCSLAVGRGASASDYAPYQVAGTAQIVGQAAVTTRAGDTKLGAGSIVTVDPLTPFAQQWYLLAGTDADRFDEAPPSDLFRRARRKATADFQGRFHVDSLPAGLYLVRSTVQWQAGVPPVTMGGVVSDTVRVGAGERKTVVLSRVWSPD